MSTPRQPSRLATLLRLAVGTSAGWLAGVPCGTFVGLVAATAFGLSPRAAGALGGAVFGLFLASAQLALLGSTFHPRPGMSAKAARLRWVLSSIPGPAIGAALFAASETIAAACAMGAVAGAITGALQSLRFDGLLRRVGWLVLTATSSALAIGGIYRGGSVLVLAVIGVGLVVGAGWVYQPSSRAR